MSQLLTIDVDASGLIAALLEVGERAEVPLKRAAYASANSIAREAKLRVARATGKTQAGIVVEEADHGNGYVVLATRSPFPTLPLLIEKGTQRGRPGSHTSAARPFFDASARLEEAPHRRRVIEALNDAIREAGLGE